MKVFLDDERSTPKGWTRTYTADETIELLKTGEVTELSLDYHLGDTITCGNGFDVLIWLEEQLIDGNFILPQHIYIHSSHSHYRPRMQLAVANLYRNNT